MVALLAEGVDRNQRNSDNKTTFNVALLAEGVDRNDYYTGALPEPQKSPSSRRAWIEIDVPLDDHVREGVALLAEGVDRNFTPAAIFAQYASRPPRGGRG